MSFRCERCKQAFPTYESPIRVVAETRLVPKKEPHKDQTRSEIVREESLCTACAQQHFPQDEEVQRQASMRSARERRLQHEQASSTALTTN